MDSANCAYMVEAAILHTGLSITAGHYTTLLFEAGQAYFYDDNATPQRLSPSSDFHTVGGYGSREVYLLVCRREGARS